MQDRRQRLGLSLQTVRSIRVTQQDLGFGARGFHRDCMVYGLVMKKACLNPSHCLALWPWANYLQGSVI